MSAAKAAPIHICRHTSHASYKLPVLPTRDDVLVASHPSGHNAIIRGNAIIRIACGALQVRSGCIGCESIDILDAPQMNRSRRAATDIKRSQKFDEIRILKLQGTI